MQNVFTFLFTVLFGFLCSCSETKQDAPSEGKFSENFDMEGLTFVAQFSFSTSYAELSSLLPENRLTLLDTEDAIEYSFLVNDIPVTVKALYYGEYFFTSLRIGFDFSDRSVNQKEAFNFLSSLLHEQFGEAIFDDEINGEDALVFEEITMDADLIRDVTLQVQGNYLVVTYSSQQNPDVNYENGTEGEWIQRGEDGEWVWMPK